MENHDLLSSFKEEDKGNEEEIRGKTKSVDETVKAHLRGTIVRFENNGIIAIVETEYGEAMLDVNDPELEEIRIGDEVEIEDAGYYIQNGKIITVAPDRIVTIELRGNHKYYRLLGD